MCFCGGQREVLGNHEAKPTHRCVKPTRVPVGEKQWGSIRKVAPLQPQELALGSALLRPDAPWVSFMAGSVLARLLIM